MNKRIKLKICNWSLLVVFILTLASSIQLEASGDAPTLWVYLHVFIASTFMALILWHVYLHFKWNNWSRLLRGKKKGIMKWMSAFCLLVIVSAVLATIDWFMKDAHTGPGAVHGKIGFLFLIFVLIHLIKHIRFYRR